MCHVAQRGRPDVKRRARVSQPHGTKYFAYVGRIVYCHQKEKGNVREVLIENTTEMHNVERKG